MDRLRHISRERHHDGYKGNANGKGWMNCQNTLPLNKTRRPIGQLVLSCSPVVTQPHRNGETKLVEVYRTILFCSFSYCIFVMVAQGETTSIR